MIIRGQLAGAAGSIFSVNGAVKVKTILFFNSGATTVTVYLHDVPNSGGALGTASSTNQILQINLAPKETYEFSPTFPLDYSAINDSLQAYATTGNQVNYRVMGVEG